MTFFQISFNRKQKRYILGPKCILTIFKNFNFREGSACHSYQVDTKGKKWPIPHRRIEWTEEEYSVRNRQVRERCFEVSNALKLALKLNEEPENVKYFMGM